MNTERVTGKELELERRAKDVSVTALAYAMGVAHSRVSHIEGSRFVTDKAARRYREALATFEDVETSPDAA